MFIQVSKYRGEVSSSAEHTSISHSCGAGVVEGHSWSMEERMSHKTAKHERCVVLKSLAPLKQHLQWAHGKGEGRLLHERICCFPKFRKCCVKHSLWLPCHCNNNLCRKTWYVIDRCWGQRMASVFLKPLIEDDIIVSKTRFGKVWPCFIIEETESRSV